ncbi:hypothetical protein M422DRAFT_50061 [Sphaerobolus stellatus SS14]|uniref:Uncharacterized protein n=1 Tax=Sphaerobolus stellatus (strain SS14) TaxID=990650 RepID=A0A0C9UTY4_SPHS4|nr:hypothetical protein M422DRAFT_50061 [Sphaerobolus stellatus SS14]
MLASAAIRWVSNTYISELQYSVGQWATLNIYGLLTENPEYQVKLAIGAHFHLKPILSEDGVPLRPGGCAPPPPPPPPSPPKLQSRSSLSIRLGRRIGYGRFGNIYEADVIGDGVQLPPLVVKIARQYRNVELAREAAFYRDYRAFQGTIIPKCYGFFQTRLQNDLKTSPWKFNRESQDEREIEDDLKYSTEIQEEDRWEIAQVPINDQSSIAHYHYRPSILHEAEECVASALRSSRQSRQNILSILVLERLGDSLPLYAPVDPFEYAINLNIHFSPLTSIFRKDVRDLFEDLGKFGIIHGDLRYTNILQASQTARNVICPIMGMHINGG